MSITGHPGGAPAKVGVPLADLTAGLYVAIAVLGALREREGSGQGQYVDVSLLESAVSLAVWEAGRYWATGEVGGPLGSAHQSQAPYQAVPTADGWLTLGAITPKTWQGLCAVLGLDELVDDPRFARSTDRHAHRSELLPLVEERTRRHPTDELVARLEAAGVPCAPIATYDQVFGDAHLAAREFFWDAAHPTAGDVRQLGSPMRLSRTPPTRAAAGPPLGWHTREVLREAGLDDARIDALVASRAVAEAGGGS